MEIKDILKELREDKNLNQTELGEKLNMTQRKISHMETGKSEPSIEDLKTICLFYNVSADYILGLTKEPRKLK